MIGAGVVGDLVLDDLDARARARRPPACRKLGEVAEVLLDPVEIDRAVAVVVGDGLAVVDLLAFSSLLLS